MMRFITILFFCCSQLFVFAQQENTVVPIVDSPLTKDQVETENEEPDSTFRYERRFLNEEKLEALIKQKPFQYKDWENDTLSYEDFFKRKNESSSGSSFKGFNAGIFLWIILAIVLVFIALELAGMSPRQLFKKPTTLITEKQIAADDIHRMDFEKEIEAAIASGNFNLAIRIYYLKLLKYLNDRQEINWQPNKTNWQYYFEIKNQTFKKAFQQATLLFEYAWYGKGTIDEITFAQYREWFTKLQQQTN